MGRDCLTDVYTSACESFCYDNICQLVRMIKDRAYVGKNRYTHHTALHINSVFLKKFVLETNNQHISSLDTCHAYKQLRKENN